MMEIVEGLLKMNKRLLLTANGIIPGIDRTGFCFLSMKRAHLRDKYTV